MDQPFHRLSELFAQLGLPSDEPGMRAFIAGHADDVKAGRLTDAPFWTPVQAQFLREAVDEDSDWAEVVDHLDAEFRQV